MIKKTRNEKKKKIPDFQKDFKNYLSIVLLGDNMQNEKISKLLFKYLPKQRIVVYNPTSVIPPYAESIHDSIEKSDFVIADISTITPNLIYELGYVTALRKHMIIIVNEMQKIDFALLPWLLQKQMIFFYSNKDLDTFAKRVGEHIQEKIKEKT